jgi:hypothetical protein
MGFYGPFYSLKKICVYIMKYYTTTSVRSHFVSRVAFHNGCFLVMSAKNDNIFWEKKCEETLFYWWIWTTFLQIFSHPHLYEKTCADDVVCSSQCRLLNLTTYFERNVKKHCSTGEYEQHFFKYFPIHTLVYEKTWADDVVCWNLVLWVNYSFELFMLSTAKYCLCE